MTDRKTRIARAICAERCAEYGEPPCYEFFGEIEPHRRTMDCSDAHHCSCEQLAVAVEAELTREASDDAA